MGNFFETTCRIEALGVRKPPLRPLNPP